MSWLKRLFCKHDYVFVRNIYGDEIVNHAFKRSVWKCQSCGKTFYGSFPIFDFTEDLK